MCKGCKEFEAPLERLEWMAVRESKACKEGTDPKAWQVPQVSKDLKDSKE